MFNKFLDYIKGDKKKEVITITYQLERGEKSSELCRILLAFCIEKGIVDVEKWNIGSTRYSSTNDTFEIDVTEKDPPHFHPPKNKKLEIVPPAENVTPIEPSSASG